MFRRRRGAGEVVVRAHPNGTAARLLALVKSVPGISLDRLVTLTGAERHSVSAALARFRRAGHVSSDTIDGDLCYWLERRQDPTARDRVLARLQRGPATWAELREISEDGLSAIMDSLTRDGLVKVETRTRKGYAGHTVSAPNLYHATTPANGPTIVAP